jgi:hypothetical protein
MTQAKPLTTKTKLPTIDPGLIAAPDALKVSLETKLKQNKTLSEQEIAVARVYGWIEPWIEASENINESFRIGAKGLKQLISRSIDVVAKTPLAPKPFQTEGGATLGDAAEVGMELLEGLPPTFPLGGVDDLAPLAKKATSEVPEALGAILAPIRAKGVTVFGDAKGASPPGPSAKEAASKIGGGPPTPQDVFAPPSGISAHLPKIVPSESAAILEGVDVAAFDSINKIGLKNFDKALIHDVLNLAFENKLSTEVWRDIKGTIKNNKALDEDQLEVFIEALESTKKLNAEDALLGSSGGAKPPLSFVEPDEVLIAPDRQVSEAAGAAKDRLDGFGMRNKASKSLEESGQLESDLLKKENDLLDPQAVEDDVQGLDDLLKGSSDKSSKFELWMDDGEISYDIPGLEWGSVDLGDLLNTKGVVGIKKHIAEIEKFIASQDPNDLKAGDPRDLFGEILRRLKDRVKFMEDGGWEFPDEVPDFAEEIWSKNLPGNLAKADDSVFADDLMSEIPDEIYDDVFDIADEYTKGISGEFPHGAYDNFMFAISDFIQEFRDKPNAADLTKMWNKVIGKAEDFDDMFKKAANEAHGALDKPLSKADQKILDDITKAADDAAGAAEEISQGQDFFKKVGDDIELTMPDYFFDLEDLLANGTDEAIVEALEKLKSLVGKLPTGPQMNMWNRANARLNQALRESGGALKKADDAAEPVGEASTLLNTGSLDQKFVDDLIKEFAGPDLSYTEMVDRLLDAGLDEKQAAELAEDIRKGVLKKLLSLTEPGSDLAEASKKADEVADLGKADPGSALAKSTDPSDIDELSRRIIEDGQKAVEDGDEKSMASLRGRLSAYIERFPDEASKNKLLMRMHTNKMNALKLGDKKKARTWTRLTRIIDSIWEELGGHQSYFEGDLE